jgi:putative chitobiose transport system substrate-binding protein
MFVSGQVAMITTGMQFLSFMKTSNPAFYQKIAVAPQISFSDSSHEAVPPNIAAMNVAVLASSPRKKAAFQFAAFVTNAKNQTALAERVAVLPSTVASYREPFFAAASGDALMDRARALSVAQAERGAVLVPPMINYNKFRNSYARNLQSVMLGKSTVTAALTDLDATWRALHGCVR